MFQVIIQIAHEKANYLVAPYRARICELVSTCHEPVLREGPDVGELRGDEHGIEPDLQDQRRRELQKNKPVDPERQRILNHDVGFGLMLGLTKSRHGNSGDVDVDPCDQHSVISKNQWNEPSGRYLNIVGIFLASSM